MRLAQQTIVRLVLIGMMPVAAGACSLAGPSAAPAGPVAPRSGGADAVSTAPTGAPDAGEDTAGGPGAAEPTAAEELRARVVEVALQSIGTPYEWGGTDANGFDCSGLIQYAYARMGIRLPRRSTAQIRSGAAVDPRPHLLEPGDILGFSADGGNGTSHVGLYVGGDDFIHSSSSGVRVSSLRNPYWQRRLVAARRVVE